MIRPKDILTDAIRGRGQHYVNFFFSAVRPESDNTQTCYSGLATRGLEAAQRNVINKLRRMYQKRVQDRSYSCQSTWTTSCSLLAELKISRH